MSKEPEETNDSKRRSVGGPGFGLLTLVLLGIVFVIAAMYFLLPKINFG